MKVRPAAVAGLFYEADAGKLQRNIDALLANTVNAPHPFPRALIVPHAGYVYSGQTAAEAYARLTHHERPVRRVALFGPAHRVYLKGMAVPSAEAFETPLGRIELDRAGIAGMRQMTGVAVSDEAHREEHSLEVQLPFLQTVLGDFTLVPVVVGQSDPTSVAAAMDSLWRDPDTLLVVSTDLSHFHHYDQARQIDTATCERLLARATSLSGEEACGAQALNGLMSTDRCHSLDIELLELCNSGDTAGDRNRVVGYGAFSLH